MADNLRRHLIADQWPDVVYAIGDVHGRFDLLCDLLVRIQNDSSTFKGDKWIVLLGDYVDRGPQSSRIISWLEHPLEGFRRIALVGNHEVMMLNYCRAPRADDPWLTYGGLRTLESYGLLQEDVVGPKVNTVRQKLRAFIPDEHLALLEALPLSLSLPGVLFVHASARLDMSLATHREFDLLWSTPRDPPPGTGLLVHGHIPSETVISHPNRICVDTGAYATGRLSAVRLTPDGGRAFLESQS